MANSQRTGGVMQRPSLRAVQSAAIPPTQRLEDFQFSDALIAQLAAVWQADLAVLRYELRPWYVRFWEWVYGC